MVKKVIFSKHAEIKLRILKKHGINFSKTLIENAVVNPDKIIRAEKSRLIAQKLYNSDHLIRVIFEETANCITIITFYPARRSRYED
jgi:uncharacterized DUF497 family protein